MNRAPSLLGAAWITFFVCATASLPRATAQDGIPLPTTADSWINAPALTLENLKGKGVVLWFFEEDCPSCRAKWPGLLETAEGFKDKPVLFIGVNSGNSRGEVERYLAEVNCKWPVICDPQRTFEKACGVGEISLQNIYQCRIITPQGQLAQGNPGDMPATVERATEGAKWNVDPDKIPAALRDVMAAVEFGMYPAAIPRLRVAAKKADTKEGAQYLIDYIKEKAQQASEEAEKLVEAGEEWKAYKAILEVSEKFNGMPLSEKLTAAKKTLAASEPVKRQLRARDQFEAATKAARAGTPQAMKKARVIVDKLIKDFGDTEAGEQAKKMLEPPSPKTETP